jgi:protocatechuate 3,4-dioxygenase beta subunit
MSLSFVSAVNDTSTDSTSTSTVTQEDANPVDSKVLVKDEVTSTKADTNATVKAVKIKANNVKAYSGGNYTFKATVVDEDNNLVPDGKFVIKFNGKTHITTQIKNGKLSYKYVMPDYSAKNYTLQYVYVQNDNYGRYELNKTLTLMKGNSTIPTNESNVTPVTIAAGRIETRAGDTVLFNGIVFDDKGVPVSEGKVVIKLNGKTHVTTYIKNNRFEYEYVMPKYSAKDYALQYVYVQNEKYGRYELNTTLKIFDKNYQNTSFYSTTVIADDVVVYRNCDVELKGKVVDSNNTPVSGGEVIVKLNGRTIQRVGVNNGTFQTMITADYSPKNYLLTYVYGFNFETSLRSETNRLFTVLNKVDPNKTGVIIKANDISTVLGTTLRVNGTVTDENGKAVKKGKVQLKIVETNQLLGTFSVSKGKFKGNVTVPSGNPQNYTIQYVYLKNSNYSEYKLNRILSLEKQNSTINFYCILNPIDLSTTLNPNNECIEIYGGTAYIIINGVTDGRRAMSGNVTIEINGKTCCDGNGNPIITNVWYSEYWPDEPMHIPVSLPENTEEGIITFTFSGNEYMNGLRYTAYFITMPGSIMM